MKKLQSIPRERRARARLLPLLWLPLLAGALLSACEGDNVFPTVPIGTGGDPSTDGSTPAPGAKDTTLPTVQFAQPAAGTLVAVGDSVFTQVRIGDDEAIASLELSGFALRGQAELGTQERVERFAAKTVALTGTDTAVTDTVISRYLLATADSVAEGGIYLVALVRDTAGNERADTVRIAIGGPSVQIQAPADGLEVRAGGEIEVRIRASDPQDRIRSVRLRASGAVTSETTLTFNTLLEQVDTAVILPVPADARDALYLDASAVNARNVEATGRSISLHVLAPSTDQTPPTVSFNVEVRPRAERDDTLSIEVSATDNTRVDTVGVSLIARWAGQESVLPVLKAAASASTFRVALHEFGVPVLADTVTVTVEVTAFAKDAAGNCAAATAPGIGLTEPCHPAEAGNIASDRAGARTDVVLVRGRTIRLANAFDRVADIVSDGQRVFLSNYSRNRIDVLTIGEATFGAAISVGSEPWGLALDGAGDTLYVANSGGTNISVVPIAQGAGLQESRRIQTADIRLYDVTFDVTADTASLVVNLDYSDRPQFLGRTAGGRIVYSTRPTPARADGTVRVLDPAIHDQVSFNRGSEIFVGYATSVQGKATVVNALSAVRTTEGRIGVCPRPLPHSAPAPACLNDNVSVVRDQLIAMRANGETDTRLDYIDASTVGLSDTTFVAVSGDRSSIAFGEGAVALGRVMLFREQPGGALSGSTTQTQDLLGNASERVIGLGLNQDGSLGVARGSQVYFFDQGLRLQGMVESGSPAGGTSLHPDSRDYLAAPAAPALVSFASGYDQRGDPYVDVIHTHSFRTIRRIYVRDGVIGSLITTRTGSAALHVFALTRGGLVEIPLTESDLQS